MAAADDSAILEAREASIETLVSMPAAADDSAVLLSDETFCPSAFVRTKEVPWLIIERVPGCDV